jgi:hypothetical protein
MTRRSAYDLRTLPGSIHRPLSDAQILRSPDTIAPWIDQLRRDWKAFPDQRAEFTAMGERLQKLHVSAFGVRHQ